MTPEELRKLDAEVAKNVMGATLIISDLTEQVVGVSWAGYLGGGELPRYSIQMEHAMEVVQKIREWGFDIEMIGNRGESIWYVNPHWPTKINGKWWNISGESDALPEAICHAALKCLAALAALAAVKEQP